MIIFYTRTAKSAPTDPRVPLALAIHPTIRSVGTFAVLSVIMFLAVWPQILLWMAGVFVLRAITDLLLFHFGVGMFRIYSPGGISADVRPYTLFKQLGKLFVFALAFFVILFLFIRR